MNSQSLQKIGLSDKEAVIYLTSLEMGPSTILEISKQSKIKRPTVHIIVENFIKKGLASSFEKGKKRYFSVESPERLLSIFNIRKKEIEEQEREFTTFLPELKQIFASGLVGGKPVVRYFEGKAGIEAIIEDIIQTKAKVTREFTSLDNAYEYFPPKPGDHREKVAKVLQETRVIYTSKKGPILPKQQGPLTSLFVPPSDFPFSCDITSYNNKVAIIAYGKDISGVLLENEEMAKTINSIFELAWKGGTN